MRGRSHGVKGANIGLHEEDADSEGGETEATLTVLRFLVPAEDAHPTQPSLMKYLTQSREASG